MAVEDYFERIEKYLAQEMSEEERSQFEEEIRNNASLKQDLLKTILANEAIGLSIEDDIRAKLDKIKAEEMSKEDGAQNQPKVRKLFSPIRLAAGIALLIAAGWIFTSIGNSSDYQLTKQFYANATVGTLKGSDDPSPELQSGLQALIKDRDYTKAIAEFEKIKSDNENYPSAQYYLGHAFLLDGQGPKALPIFDAVLEGPLVASFIDKEEVEWNRVLALMGGDEEKFNAALASILANNNHSYHDEASGLKSKMNSIWRKFM